MFEIISLVYLCIASTCDVIRKKIPNVLNFPTMLAAVVLLSVYDVKLLPTRLLLCFCFFLLGGLGVSGWGDIKMMMILSLLNSWQTTILCFVIAQVMFIVFCFIRKPAAAKKTVQKGLIQMKLKLLLCD